MEQDLTEQTGTVAMLSSKLGRDGYPDMFVFP
jgi:hypothetical protein